MPKYEITSPDGKRFEVTAPEGASQEEVLAYAKKSFLQTSQQSPSPFTKSVAEIPQTPGALVKDIIMGAGETPANLLGQIPSMVGGGLGGAYGAIEGAITGQGVGAQASKRMQEWSEATRLYHPKTYTGQRLDETIGEGIDLAKKGVGGAYQYINEPIDTAKNLTQRALGNLTPEQFKQKEQADRYTRENRGELAGSLAEAAMFAEGVRAPLAGGQQAIRNIQEARRKAQETQRDLEAKQLQEAKAREEARRAMGNEDFQGRQGGEVDFATVPPEPYNPTVDAKLPQGKRVNLDAIDSGDAAGSFEQGTKPGMRVGPLATDPLKREADLTATPTPAESLPSDMVGTGRDRTAYQWRYPDEQMGRQSDAPYSEYPQGQGALDLQRRTAPPERAPEPPAQGTLDLQPKLGDRVDGLKYTPEEVIYDTAPEQASRTRQQALTEREGIPYEVIKIAEDQANRAAKIAEAEGIPFERLAPDTAKALAEARETARTAGRSADAAREALADIAERTLDNTPDAWKRVKAAEQLYGIIARDARAETVFTELAKSPHLNVVEKAVARLIAKTLDQAGVVFKIVDQETLNAGRNLRNGANVSGVYRSQDGAILIREFRRGDERTNLPSPVKTFLHEGIHAIVADWQRVFPDRPESRVIRYLYEKAWKADMAKTGRRDKEGVRYGFTDELEFIAEVQANPEFRRLLSNLSLTPYERAHVAALVSQVKSGMTSSGKLRTAWDAWLAAVSQMIGWKGGVDNLGKVAFEASATVVKSFEHPGGEAIRSTRTVFNEAVDLGLFGADGKLTQPLADLLDKSSIPYSKPTLAPSRKDVISAATGETRMPNKFLDDVGGKVDELPAGLYTKGLGIIGSISKMFTETGNPMLKWAYEFASNSRNMSAMKAELLKEGASFKFGRIESTKVVDPNAPVPRLRKLIGNNAQMVKFIEAVNEFSGKKLPREGELMSRGMSQVAADTYKVVAESLKTALRDVNEARVAAGLKPIAEKPGYFMKYHGEGQWLARVVDKNGATEWFHRFSTKAEADAVAAEMAQKTGSKSSVSMEAPELRGNKYNANTSVLEHILDTMSVSDPRRAIIQNAAKESLGKRGFGVHGSFRKDIAGGEYATKGGKVINKVGSDFLRTYEDYIDGAYRYAENLKITKAISTIQADGRVPPALSSYIQNYLNRTRGAGKDFATDLESWANQGWTAVMGKTPFKNVPGVRQSMEKLNQAWMTSTLLIWNAKFAVGNLAQSTVFGSPILAHWKYNLGYKGDVVSSMLNGYKDMFSRDGAFSKYRDEYAVPRGEIDPTFIQEEGAAWARNAVVDWGGGLILGRKAESFSRLHAHSMGFHFAEQAGLKGKELYSTAESIANDIMVNYKKQDKAAIIENAGIIGTAIKPLWSFQNWYFSTVGTLMREAFGPKGWRDPKRMIPLVNMMVSTSLFAGIVGSMPWTFIDTMWNFFRDSHVGKQLLGPKVSKKSLSEIALSNLPDAALFGALDAATRLGDSRGSHIAGGLMSPEIKTPELLKNPSGYVAEGGFMKSAPGLKFGYDVYDTLSTLFMQALGKNVASGEMKQKMKNVMPPVVDRLLDYFDTMGMDGQDWILRDSNLPRPSASARGYAGVIQDKDLYEKINHVVVGNTLEQERKERSFREAKKTSDAISKERQHVVDLLVDNIQHGAGDFNKLVDKAVELGYSGRELNQAVKEAYTNRIIGEDDRRAKGRSTSRRMEQQRLNEMTAPAR